MFLKENKVERKHTSCFEITYQTYVLMVKLTNAISDRAELLCSLGQTVITFQEYYKVVIFPIIPSKNGISHGSKSIYFDNTIAI
jgi:hypothetical protein